MRGRPVVVAVSALLLLTGCALTACAQPDRVDAAPRPIPGAQILDSGTPPPTSTVPSSTPPVPTDSPAKRPAPGTPSHPPVPTPTPGPSCVPQYTVTADTYARDAPGGNLIGRVAVGTHVNVRKSDGVWAYGYVGSIDNKGGGWAWMLHEKMHRTGQFCS